MIRPGLRPACAMSAVRTRAASALGERGAHQAEPGLGHGDEHRLVLLQACAHELEASGPVARRVGVEQRVVLEGPGGTRRHRLPRGDWGPIASSGWSGRLRVARSATVPDTSGQSLAEVLRPSARTRRRHRGSRRRSARSPARGAAAGVVIVCVAGRAGPAGTSQLTSNSMPSGSLRVQRLRGAVVGRADERAVLGEHAADPLQLGEGVDLPREVVEADGRAARGGRRPRGRRWRTGRGRGRWWSPRPAGTPPGPGSP